ncbi:MAG: FecR domain-containing protein [Bacteroidales bacterium]
MTNRQQRIGELIGASLLRKLTPEEELELRQWRSESAHHEQLYQQLSDPQHISRLHKKAARFDCAQGWHQFESKKEKRTMRHRVLKVCRYAACLLLPLGATYFILQHSNTSVVNPDSQITVTSEIRPGAKKATLTLGNGSVVDLQTEALQSLRETDGTTIQLNSAGLNYQLCDGRSSAESEKSIYNKIEIPRGGEYSLYLSDGTKVYLNAMSSLRYPVKFSGSERVVELCGEAYFEVRKGEKPFVVRTRGMDIEVLGTSFNISAYPEEEYKTTLVTGSVRIHGEHDVQCELRPSQQAHFTPGASEISVQEVDVNLFTSWIQGKIYFRDARLQDILHELSRWYEMEVVYEDPSIREMQFGCNINRSAEITPFLKLLEESGQLKITREGKRLRFSLKSAENS